MTHSIDPWYFDVKREFGVHSLGTHNHFPQIDLEISRVFGMLRVKPLKELVLVVKQIHPS